MWDESQLSGLAVIRLDELAHGRPFQSLGQQVEVRRARLAIKRLMPTLGMFDAHMMIGVMCLGRPLEEMAEAWCVIGGSKNVAYRVRQAFRVLRIKRWATDEEVVEEEPVWPLGLNNASQEEKISALMRQLEEM